MYGVNKTNGYWRGMYQWQTTQALEEYKKSFVFKMMNKRATKSTLSSMEIENQNLTDFIIAILYRNIGQTASWMQFSDNGK